METTDNTNNEEFYKTAFGDIEKMLEKELSNDPNIAQALLEEQGIPVKTYRIDFNKVTTLEELLKILQHLNFVISGPQEYFDEHCKGIQQYLTLMEDVEEGS